MSSPRWRRWLEGPRTPLGLALLACLLSAPALGAGLATEDWVLRDNAMRPVSEGVNLYATLRSAAEVQVAQTAGTLPWLASPDLRLSFFRPVASLWLRFDYRVLGDAAWLMHLESIALYGALVYFAARLFRQLLPQSFVAGLAALVYAVDDAHGHAVGWLANRNALLAAVFGVLAVGAHHRWRSEGLRRDAWLAPLWLVLALGSSELGLGALGYLVAYAAFVDQRPRRFAALAPAAAVGLGWATLYRALGHGTAGSEIYLDPWRAPLAFAAELPGRLGALALGQLAYPPADSWVTRGDGAHLSLALGGSAALVVLAALALRHGPVARFAFTGMLLSLVPAAATAPSDRTLFLSGLGAALCLAAVLARAAEGAARWLVALALPIGVLHLVVAPVLLPWRTLSMSRFHERVARASESAYANVISGDELVVALGAPDHYFCSLLRPLRRHLGRGPAPPVACLAATSGRIEVERVDDHALSLRAPGGFLEPPFNRIFRSRRQVFRSGERVYIRTLEAEVTEVSPRGEPVAVTFRFNWPLDSEKLRFVSFDGERFVPEPLPRAGERRALTPAAR